MMCWVVMWWVQDDWTMNGMWIEWTVKCSNFFLSITYNFQVQRRLCQKFDRFLNYDIKKITLFLNLLYEIYAQIWRMLCVCAGACVKFPLEFLMATMFSLSTSENSSISTTTYKPNFLIFVLHL